MLQRKPLGIHVILAWNEIGRSAIFGRKIEVPDREVFSRRKKSILVAKMVTSSTVDHCKMFYLPVYVWLWPGFNCWFSFAPVFQWWCSTPQGISRCRSQHVSVESSSLLHHSIWTASSEFVSSSIPSWQILTAHAQPFRGARDLAFCLKVPLDSLLVWASSGGSGKTARIRRLAWTFAARIMIRTKFAWRGPFICDLFVSRDDPLMS